MLLVHVRRSAYKLRVQCKMSVSRAAVQVVGNLLPGPAAALGLTTDVIVSAGSGDNACSALGVGAVEHGEIPLHGLGFMSMLLLS